MVEEVDLRRRYKQERGDILVSGLVETINESLKNILGTQTGTRLFNRDFGSRIANLLFEPMSDSVAKFLQIEIQQVIERFEPRIEISYAQSQIIPVFDQNLYRVKLVYRIISSEDTGEFNTFLERLGT